MENLSILLVTSVQSSITLFAQLHKAFSLGAFFETKDARERKACQMDLLNICKRVSQFPTQHTRLEIMGERVHLSQQKLFKKPTKNPQIGDVYQCSCGIVPDGKVVQTSIFDEMYYP